ncbi:MAG: sulfotransferase, partial [Elainella sp. Prado103]|nr:sulfotransferase [Elainella sp. Prado103]
MTDSELQQPVLIITGMHRSGTSLTSALLQSAGLDIGKDLLESNPWNPKGFFENVNFLNFHEAALQSLGFCREGWIKETIDSLPEYFVDQAKTLVQNNASTTQPWGWKEPRTTLFLKFWASLLPEAKYLLIYRSPWEVLDSLYRRGDLIFEHNPEFALKVWMAYNQAILEHYRNVPEKCFLTHINSIVQDPQQFLVNLREKLNLPLSSPQTEIYEQSLLHVEASNSHRPTIIKNFFPEAFELYTQLNSLADLPEQGATSTVPLNSQAWLLQDWIDLHRQHLIHQQQLSVALQKADEEFRHQQQQMSGEKDALISQLQGLIPHLEQQRDDLRQTFDQSQQKVIEFQSELEESNLKLSSAIESLKAQREQAQMQEVEIQNLKEQLYQARSQKEHCVQELEITRFRSDRFRSKLQQSNQRKREFR